MGRKKTLDRDNLLGVVATIVANGGVGALTIDGVAKAAGISKGGVQSTFGSKEDMIKALFDRCQQEVDARLAPLAECAGTGQNWVLAYLELISQVDAATGVITAGVFAAMAKTPVYREDLHRRYADRLRDIQASGENDRNMRLVFLAAHGAFFLRYFGFMNILPEQWDQMFSDIRGLALSSTAPGFGVPGQASSSSAPELSEPDSGPMLASKKSSRP